MIRTSVTGALLAASVLATFVFVLIAPAAGAAPGADATPSASWRCIAGICVGHSRASLAYRYGGVAQSDIPSRTVQVTGGRVWVCFWRCFGSVTEDGFTYYGGNQRPPDHVLTVGTCSPIFRLPDGVTLGTAIPFGRRWHGYRRIARYLEGGAFQWERVALKDGTPTKVTLMTGQGRVQCVSLEQPR